MRKALVALGLGAVLSTSSCLGPNNAWNSLHSWNSTLSESKWLNELAFIGLNFIPVYPIFYFGDIIIFNSIEFWGGENPISPADPFTPQAGK